jgi:hypothetical protein
MNKFIKIMTACSLVIALSMFVFGCAREIKEEDKGVKIRYSTSSDNFFVMVDGYYIQDRNSYKAFETKNAAIEYCVSKGLISDKSELK